MLNYMVTQKSIIGTRDEQQDFSYYCADGSRVFAIVCDGMGGTAGGALASQTATMKLKELYNARKDETIPSFFLHAIDILDESVVALQRELTLQSCGTTIVAAIIEGTRLYWLSVGDSRLYIIRNDEIVQVTRDHNFALSLEQWTLEELDTVQEVPVKYRADALISFIGMGGVKIYDINETGFILEPHDKILLTTDGLTKVLTDDEILAELITDSTENVLNKLFSIAAKRAFKAQDNTTCIIIDIGGNDNG